MNTIFILMGVSGVGKTTLGKMLAKKLSLPFYDADDFHPDSNKEKMKAGNPLDDEDRRSWLDSLSGSIEKWSNIEGAVLACSALKESHRKKLAGRQAVNIEWIYLYEEFATIAERIEQRKDHFFDPALLKSQFQTLEPPEYGIHIKVNSDPEISLRKIMEKTVKPSVGIIGLGVMGQNLALNIAGKGFPVSVYNRQQGEKEKDIAKEFAETHAR